MKRKAASLPYPIEHRVASRRKRRRIQDIALMAIFLLVTTGVLAAAPNTLQLLKHVEKHFGPRERINKRLYQALVRLRARGLLTSKNTLTKAGRMRASALSAIEAVAPSVPLRWDRKWRVVIFDIWERRSNVRHRLRGLLGHMGFTKLQASVWVYPYPCEELFVYLRTELRLGRGVRYLVVDEIDNDIELRKEFDLPLK